MSRYSIDRALADGDDRSDAKPLVRRLWIDNPYWTPKSAIVNAVAEANHSRLVSSEGLGFVTIIGHDPDVDVVELLGTSLLLQATRAMTGAGPQVARNGASNTRSYRHAFLLAYASRVGERLRTTAADTESSVDSERGGALVPVLAQRTQAVDAALDQATQLLQGADLSTLPEPVQQALGLVTAAAVTVDELLDALGVDNPDEHDSEGTATGNAAPSGDAAKSVDAETLDLKYRALSVLSASAAI